METNAKTDDHQDTTPTQHCPRTGQGIASLREIDEPADVFDAVCADWPHHIAVLVNSHIFFEVDECDPQKMIDHLEKNLRKWRTYPPAYAYLKEQRSKKGRG